MRNREIEWSLPMVRFFGALFIPPICSTVILSVLTFTTQDYGPALFAHFLGSFMFSAVPSVFWFVSIEKLYEKNESIRLSKLRFTLAGALLGAAFTVALFLLVLVISGAWRDLVFILNPTYLLIGLTSGSITALTIYPKKKVEPNQTVENNAGQPPPEGHANIRRALP